MFQFIVVLGALLLSFEPIQVSAAPQQGKNPVTMNEIDQFCTSDDRMCNALIESDMILHEVEYSIASYCHLKERNFLTAEGLTLGEEMLYDFNELPTWPEYLDANAIKFATKGGILQGRADYPDCLDWSRFTLLP